MSKPLVLLALALALLLGPRPAAAQPAITLEVTPAFEGNYAPDRWLPLSIVLRNSGPAARVTVSAASALSAARNSATVELAGGGEAALTLYAAMDRDSRELRVSVERDGAVLAEQRVAVRPREGERMLGLVSAQPLELSLPRRQDLARLPFLPFASAPAQLPDRLAGLSSLTLIVLGELPAESLAPAQLATLHSWVRSGGHLVIGGGPGAATTLASLPAELRLAEIGAAMALDADALGAFADMPPPDGLEGITLQPAPDVRTVGPVGAPLWAQRDVGAGRVTQLAFDPGLPELRAWTGAPALWDRLLRPTRIYNTVGLDLNADGLQAQILSSALANLPAINLPNTGPLFALLVAYTILIGPGLALLLRRLDRQALGWIVLPAVALGVATIAGGVAVASRADQRIVSQVTLVEQVDAATARARAALGILTPRDERFAVAVGGDAVARPIVAGVASFGPINGAGGELAQGGEDLNLVLDRWELQGAQAEALVPLPALEAELSLGPNGIVATVRNSTGGPLRDVSVVYAGRVARLGDLAPEQVATAEWPPPGRLGAGRPELVAPLSTLVLGEALSAGRAPGSAPDRRVLIQESMLNAVAAAGQEGEGLEPLVLAWLDTSPLPLTLAAPGVVAQQVGLLVGRPRIVGKGELLVPAGWMQIEQGDAPRATCTGDLGRGLVASPGPLTMTLALPADMAALRASELSLDLQSDRQWPNAGVTTELFRWATDDWVEISFDGPGTLALSNPEPFVQGGRLRLRLSGRIDEAGCVFADAALRGALP